MMAIGPALRWVVADGTVVLAFPDFLRIFVDEIS
jgi:hypothetical protein